MDYRTKERFSLQDHEKAKESDATNQNTLEGNMNTSLLQASEDLRFGGTIESAYNKNEDPCCSKTILNDVNMAEYISSDSCRGCGAEYESIFWLINHAKRINSCREKYTSVELDLLEEKAFEINLVKTRKYDAKRKQETYDPVIRAKRYQGEKALKKAELQKDFRERSRRFLLNNKRNYEEKARFLNFR